MNLDHDACYCAVSSRDARFDGRIFTGVKTTGIYCRPICPARTPKSESVVFFSSAAGAQEAGFRSCLRCRPECSPDLAIWRRTSNAVSRGLSLIADGALDGDDASVEQLAETAMPPAQVALASGFGSVRRFNAVFQKLYAEAHLLAADAEAGAILTEPRKRKPQQATKRLARAS